MYAVEDHSGIQRICSIKVPTVYTYNYLSHVKRIRTAERKF